MFVNVHSIAHTKYILNLRKMAVKLPRASSERFQGISRFILLALGKPLHTIYLDPSFLTISSRDIISSIEFARQERPGATVVPDEYFCYFRHAIAADECWVKFQPEYVRGGESIPQDALKFDEAGIPRVKEVFFAGSHSDV